MLLHLRQISLSCGYLKQKWSMLVYEFDANHNTYNEFEWPRLNSAEWRMMFEQVMDCIDNFDLFKSFIW